MPEVFSFGVVSVSIYDGEKRANAGRMGPGEVMVEEGTLADKPSRGKFHNITVDRLFRIEITVFSNQLEHLNELKSCPEPLAEPAPVNPRNGGHAKAN